MDTRKFKLARFSNEIGTAFLAFAIVMLANGLIGNFLNFRWDLTATGQYSLSPFTLGVLKKIESKPGHVKATAFLRRYASTSEEKLKDDRTLDLLREYHVRSEHKIETVRVLDPEQSPAEVQRLGVRHVGTVVFEWVPDTKSETPQPPILQIVYPKDIWGLRIIDGKPGSPEFRAENAFTSALGRLMDNKLQSACVLQGHGEPVITSKENDGLKDFSEALMLHNFSVQPLRLLETRQVPMGCDVLIIAGARQTLLPGEANLLKQYALAGGRTLLLGEFNVNPGLGPLLTVFGVEMGDNLAVDIQRSFYGKPTSPIPFFGEHEIVRDLKQSGAQTILHTARSVERALGDTRGISTFDLLITSPNGWAEADYRAPSGKNKEIAFQEGTGDLKGPVTLAMAVSRRLDDAPAPGPSPAATPLPSSRKVALGEADSRESSESGPAAPPLRSKELRAVVVGDSDFSQNEHIRFGANKDFLVNSVLWLAGRGEDIAISPKDPVFNFVTITRRQIWVVFGIVVVLMPLIVLAVGIFQWWERRSL